MSSTDIDELFKQTLTGEYEDEAPWEAVHALRRLGTREVFEKAAQWCKSDRPLLRSRGANVIAQLGKTVEHRQNSFPDESYSAIVSLVEYETESQPLGAAIAALGHLDNPSAVPLIAKFHTHPSAEVRFDVAFALGCFPNDALSVSTLMRLMQDDDQDVRDWATFGLGVLGDCDSAEIRDALAHRLNDDDRDVREEAIVGLGKRHDERVLQVLLAELREPAMTDRIIEAAYLLLGMQTEHDGWDSKDYYAALREKFSVST